MTIAETLDRQFTLCIMDSPATAPALTLLRHEIAPVGTALTNGEYLRFDADFAGTLLGKDPTGATIRGTYLHEAWHVLLQHPWRGLDLGALQPDFDFNLWNAACDHEVNLAISAMQWPNPKIAPVLPEGALQDTQFTGMAAEEIYGRLKRQRKAPAPGEGKDQGPGTKDQGPGGGDGGHGTGDQPAKQTDPRRIGDFTPPPSEKSEELRTAATRALVAARMAGQLPAGLERFWDGMMNPKVPWTEVLRHLAQSVRRDDYHWSRPHPAYASMFRRQAAEAEQEEASGLRTSRPKARPFLPALHSERHGVIVLVRDTSGSIGSAEIASMTAECGSILRDLGPEKLILADCDAAVHRWDEYSPTDIPDGQARGGGGTCCAPLFERIAQEDLTPEVVVYLTDLEIFDLNKVPEPDYPVIWAVYGDPGHTKTAPWGDIVWVES